MAGILEPQPALLPGAQASLTLSLFVSSVIHLVLLLTLSCFFAVGGLDETLHLIIDSACEQNIPFVFALNRKALGRCLNKAVPVSVVGIFSYDGAQVSFTHTEKSPLSTGFIWM